MEEGNNLHPAPSICVEKKIGLEKADRTSTGGGVNENDCALLNVGVGFKNPEKDECGLNRKGRGY